MAAVAVVTGANRGIGYEVVRGLCKQFSGDVILCARDNQRGEEAINKLKEEGLQAKFHQLDITDESSVKNLKEYLLANYSGVDLLVNNAAIYHRPSSDPESKNKQIEVFKVNYLSTANVCDNLLPIVKNNGRVVNVSAMGGMLVSVRAGKLREILNDIELTRSKLDEMAHEYLDQLSKGQDQFSNYAFFGSYVIAKVFLCALTWIQQREMLIDSRKIRVFATHPGFVVTDMTSKLGELSAEEGAKSTLHAALADIKPEEGSRKVLFENCQWVAWDDPKVKYKIWKFFASATVKGIASGISSLWSK